ncbi:MAG: CBS domain-containing protein [Agarilytica sp.]
MSIEKLITKPVVSIEMDDTLALVKGLFETHNFHHLLVVNVGKLQGVISDRDLLKALSPHIGTDAETSHDAATLNKKAHQIMTRHPITATEDLGFYDLIEIFNQYNVSCIPVLDAAGKPVGIITWRDIFKAIKRPDTSI